MAVYESQFRNIWCEVHFTTPASTVEMPARWQRTALPTRYWFDCAVEFGEATDTFIMCDSNEWWYANCRTESAYQRLAVDFGDKVIRL